MTSSTLGESGTATPAAAARACPSCGAGPMRPFWSLDRIPVHSCLLVASREEALAFPTGRLTLAHCAGCGFVANTRFDPAHNAYSATYEETQGFSPRFCSFLTGLVDRLVADYDLRGRSSLEIGCGKGEFLTGLCRATGGPGVGIDPAYVPERGPGEKGIEFIRDLYSEAYSHLTADFVACRHTLEHIAPVGEFLRTVRRSLGDRKETTIFFEVPDVLRVLREGAYQDIYYEHCSYFTVGSLARLFRASGFEVLEAGLDFDDQYVILVARPADGPTTARLAVEDDLAEIDAAVAAFPGVIDSVIGGWRDRVREISAAGGRVIVWGGGSKCVAFLTTVGLTDEVHSVVDLNPYKHGNYIPGTGHEVVAPARLREAPPTHVIVMNPIYTEEIRRDLAAMGLSPEILPA